MSTLVRFPTDTHARRIALALTTSAVLHLALLISQRFIPGSAALPEMEPLRATLVAPISPPAPLPVEAVSPPPAKPKPKPAAPKRVASPPTTTEKQIATQTPVAPAESIAPPAQAPKETITDPPPAPPREPVVAEPQVPPPGSPWSTPSPEAAQRLPQRMRVDYRLLTEAGSKVGEAQVEWRREGTRYALDYRAHATGLVALFWRGELVQRSSGTITRVGLAPELFTMSRGKREPQRAEFDRAAGQLALGDELKQRSIALPDDAQDMLSFLFGYSVAAPAQDSLRVQLTDGRRLQRYQLTRIGEELLELPFGPVKTLRIKRATDSLDQEEQDFWLAIDYHYLPVKVRVLRKRDDTALEQVADKLLIE